MKTMFVKLAITCLLMELVLSQHLEMFMKGVGIKKLSRKKPKIIDKKFKKYKVGAVVKGGKGVVQGVVGKPLMLVGTVLGPVGLPIKLIGTVLKTKSALNKAKSVVLTVKKLSRDSVRYG